MYHQYIILDESINVEDNEKLRATVAYNEVYITEIEEEKRQLEEENEKVEKKYRQEKQITKGTCKSIKCIIPRIYRS